MKAVALESRLDSVSGKHQPKARARPVPLSPWSLQPVSVTGAEVIKRKGACACGGGCPSCAQERKPEAIQTKLQVSTPGDQYEQEADRMSEQITRGSHSTIQPKHGQVITESGIKRISTNEAHAGKTSEIQLSQAGGHPLSASTREFMEPRFGADFGHVRVHTDHDAHQTASQIQARAFTSGHHIWLGKGESQQDASLLAHELTHVVQQSAVTSGTVQRQPACNTSAAATAVDVYVVELPGATRSSSADFVRANSIWQQCSKQINMVGGQSWQTSVLDVDAPAGILNAPAGTVRPLTAEETQMTAHRPGGDVIHAYYIPDFTGPKVAEAFWPAQHGQSSVIVGNNARSDSFAHELGHVLLNSGNHESDPDNLMASGSIRNVGVDKLECPQCS